MSDTSPFILAGPILRKTGPKPGTGPDSATGPDSVTVWIALSKQQDVKLEVFKLTAAASDKSPVTANPLFSGTRTTIQFGTNLHVVAVTANPTGSEGLFPGSLYSYNLSFLASGKSLKNSEVFSSASNTGNVPAPGHGTSYVSYAPYDLPTFAYDPGLKDLRLFHGSCRKFHADGVDMLQRLDDFIFERAAGGGGAGSVPRPHVLLMTGDQIYGDDVADCVLEVIRGETSGMIFGPDAIKGRDAECFSADSTLRRKNGDKVSERTTKVFASDGTGSAAGGTPSCFDPGLRDKLVIEQLGMTSGLPDELRACCFSIGPTTLDSGTGGALTGAHSDGPATRKSHLVHFEEFAGMYLLGWNDLLWPAGFASRQPSDGGTDNAALLELRNSQVFLKTLSKARRALANIPTYMMLDDHDVTDDFFMDQEWCENVLHRPLGRRLIQNALVAYAVFQAWGNTPERFEKKTPGGTFLEAASRWLMKQPSPAGAPPDEKVVAAALGLPTADNFSDYLDKLREKKTLPRDFTADQLKTSAAADAPIAALDWHYQVVGTEHEILFLDTRTMRAYNGDPTSDGTEGKYSYDLGSVSKTKGHQPPSLMSDEAIKRQIKAVHIPPKSQVTFVVSPAVVIGTVTEDDGQVTTTVGVGGVYYKDVEPWFAVRGTYQRLFASLLTRGAPKDPAPVIERKIVLLTGDVHRGSTTSLRYFAKKPLDWDGAPGKFRAIFAHFVSSPFKNEDNNTRMAHNRAHFAGPSANPPDATNLSGDEAIEYDYYGVATGAYISSGNPSGVLRPTVIQVSPDIRARTVYGETTSPKDELLGALNNDPEWAYRVNYIYSDGLNKGVGGTPLLVGTPAGGSGTSSTGLWTDKDDLQFLAFSTALGQQHQQIQEFEIKGKMKVGVNHIGEIYFEDRTTSAGVKLPHVTQTLHWRVAPELQLESLNVARMTTYPVEFDLLWNSKRAPPFFKGLT